MELSAYSELRDLLIQPCRPAFGCAQELLSGPDKFRHLGKFAPKRGDLLQSRFNDFVLFGEAPEEIRVFLF